jgi:steroid 5-alpha reductase family enzyme
MIAIKTNSITLAVIKEFIIACPLGTAAVFLIINSLFCYILGVIYKSFWFYESTAIFIPLMIAIGWRQNPYATKTLRGDICILLVAAWTIKTFISYMNSRKFKFGTREDWKMSRLANYYGKVPWYFISFFILVITQVPLLLGMSLPLYYTQFGPNSKKDID